MSNVYYKYKHRIEELKRKVDTSVFEEPPKKQSQILKEKRLAMVELMHIKKFLQEQIKEDGYVSGVSER